MPGTYRDIRTKEDVESIADTIESVLDGWYGGGARIDWNDFYDRIEAGGYDLGSDTTSVACVHVKAVVRRLRRAEA